ncbi:MAG: Alanine-tRNA ligase [Microgenomates group bacterium GW2011_GWA2_44_7]|nr:MAG: Alanine-tRNA ligase [Microgenomates group bacterium GW2011_GWA2_44_7]KKT78633.1 MAG: Alanine-tRNA ligase [Microgenomates group bacterium GW2011_GWB1_44_8]
MQLTSNDIRQKYIAYFVKRGHKQIPGSSLVPENDPSVLFTTAGMHPLVPYLLGQPHPEGKRLVNYQKVFRTDDIGEVGDNFHHTFLEMLGNWSLGDYFKKESIPWSYDFLIKELNLNPDRLYVTCFVGDSDAPKDEESARIWQSLGIPTERIYFLPKKDNWWGPAGQTGPCGPDSEMFFDVTGKPCSPDCRPGCGCGRFSEVWNNVFMEYNKTADGKYTKLSQPNVDTGMGVERILAVVNGFTDNYQTELWQPAIAKISALCANSYKDNQRAFRIIADHIRASTFIISDAIEPSNKERGYVLRRLIRRAIMQMRRLAIDPVEAGIVQISNIFVFIMSPVYPELVVNKQKISQVLKEEVLRFNKTLDHGLKEFNKLQKIDGKVAFDLFQTFGFPWELTAELAAEKGQPVNQEEFKNEFEKHQDLSRTASAGMFKGGLADHSEVVTKYHSATHLLHAALRNVLGKHVHQEGSNITNERLRFDFSHPTKLTQEEVKKVENMVNELIKKDLPRNVESMTYQEALDSGALAFFKGRYPEKVTVYSFGDFSREICGGPHVESAGKIGQLKIYKTEKIATGTQRIYVNIGK